MKAIRAPAWRARSYSGLSTRAASFFRFAVRRPDSLFVRLQGPFGIEVGSLLLTPEETLFYNAMENTLLSGNATLRRIQTFLPFSISRGGLMDLFAGQIPAPEDTVALGVSREGDALTLTGRAGFLGGTRGIQVFVMSDTLDIFLAGERQPDRTSHLSQTNDCNLNGHPILSNVQAGIIIMPVPFPPFKVREPRTPTAALYERRRREITLLSLIYHIGLKST